MQLIELVSASGPRRVGRAVAGGHGHVEDFRLWPGQHRPSTMDVADDVHWGG
jgi:hypothetical protein